MNKTVPRKKTLYWFTILLAAGLLFITGGPSYGAQGTRVFRGPASSSSSLIPICSLTGKDTIYSILVNKIPGNKKYKIRLYPDAKRQVLFFSANGEEKKVYQLYMFDLDGKLVNQASIRNRETTVLANLSEGYYLFEVFSNDQRIVNGQLNVK